MITKSGANLSAASSLRRKKRLICFSSVTEVIILWNFDTEAKKLWLGSLSKGALLETFSFL